MIFHLTTAEEWAASSSAGVHTGSTRGRTLSQEGFIHCSAAEQWPEVRRAFFADVPDLVLLHIDETLLSSPLRWDDVPGAGTFPHIYGPVDLSAVVAVEVLPALDGPSRSPGRRRNMGASTKR